MQKRKLTEYQRTVLEAKSQLLKNESNGLSRDHCKEITVLLVDEDLVEEAGALFDKIWPEGT